MANGRVKGQISLGKAKVSFTQNKNSGTNRGGQTGNTRLAKSVNITSNKQVSRNSSSKAAYSAHAGQTVGLKGAKVGYVHRRAPVANSVPDRTTKNPSQYNTHVSSTVGLKGAGKPFSQQKRTTTQFDAVPDKISKNTRQQNPHVSYSVGLAGAKKNGAKGTASRSNIGKSPRTVNSQGLKRANRRAPMQNIQSSGTGGKSGGGRKTPLVGNKKVVTSTLGPQKNYNSSIPAAVRKAAARAPSAGSSKPSFTSRIVKILSK